MSQAWCGHQHSCPRRAVWNAMSSRCDEELSATWCHLCVAGTAIDVGGGNEFGGGDEDEGCDDTAETKLDQFWQFSEIEVRVRFESHWPSSRSTGFVAPRSRTRSRSRAPRRSRRIITRTS
jgi:hypothetical protein